MRMNAFYDLKIGPVSYDIVQFLINAELARVRAKADSLHLVVVPYKDGVGGMFRDKSDLYSIDEMHWRLWNIVIPAAQLIGATVELTRGWQDVNVREEEAVWPEDWTMQSFANRPHLLGPAVQAHKNGEAIPKLRSSRYADSVYINAPRYITITHRNTKPAIRNTDREMLWKIGDCIGSSYNVMHIFDTADTLHNGLKSVGPLSVDLRLACYRHAALNILPNGGPASLCVFSDAPYLMFDAGDHIPGWREMMVDQGIPYYASPPWAHGRQHFIYGKPTYELMVKSIDAVL